jgi:hypothetical protein
MKSSSHNKIFVLLLFVCFGLVFTIALSLMPWDFGSGSSENSSFTSEVKQEQKANVTIKVGIVYTMGGVQHVAREKFYLVDKLSPELTREEAGLAIRLGRVAGAMQGERSDPLARNAIQTVVTDFEGVGTFRDVTGGDYYILGLTSTRGGGHAYWRLPIRVDGNSTILLDQNNAAELSEQ